MKNTTAKAISKKTYYILALVLFAVLSLSLGFGIAAGNGVFAMISGGKSVYADQWEWQQDSAAMSYDNERTVTVQPGVPTTVSGLYLLNPDGTIMPAKNNHMHLQVNFTFNPGTYVPGTGYLAKGTTNTYKYSMDFAGKKTVLGGANPSECSAYQALGNNGSTENQYLVYPRGAEPNSGNYLFQIKYIPGTVTFSLEITFNSMTPTGSGTFDIRYFAHPGAITKADANQTIACDYVSGYNKPTDAGYTVLAADKQAAFDTYEYFDQYYNKGTYKKQVLHVKVEKEYNAAGGAAGSGLPVLNATEADGYQQLGNTFLTPDKMGATISPMTFVSASADKEFGTYGFVENSLQAYRKVGGVLQKVDLAKYYDITYVPYIKDLVADRNHSAGSVFEPVPSTLVSGGSSSVGFGANVVPGNTTRIAGTNDNAFAYFSSAKSVQLSPKAGADMSELYGYTLYFAATVERTGASQPMQSQAKFKLTITDTVKQISNSFEDKQEVPESFTLESEEKTGSAATATKAISISQLIDFADANRYVFVNFSDGKPVHICPKDDHTACGTGVTGTETNHDANGSAATLDNLFARAELKNGKLELQRKSRSTYQGKLFMLVRVKDTRSETGTETTLCVRLDFPSEGLVAQENGTMTANLTGATALPGGSSIKPIKGLPNGYFTSNGDTIPADTLKFSLENYLAHYIYKLNDFDFTDESTYTTKREYGLKITADMLYKAVSMGQPQFRINGAGYLKPQLFSVGGVYFSWQYVVETDADGYESSAIYIYPYRGTGKDAQGAQIYREMYDSGLSRPSIDVVLTDETHRTLASAVKYRNVQFDICVENTAPNDAPNQTIKDYVHGNLINSASPEYNNQGADNDTMFNSDNVVKLIADNSYYNSYNKSGGTTVANANRFGLKNSFEMNVYGWASDIDIWSNAAPVSGYVYDKLYFDVTTLQMNSAYIDVFVRDAGGWVSLKDYTGSKLVEDLRFEAKAKTTSNQSVNLVVKDSFNKEFKSEFYIKVEDSRPVYRIDAENGTGMVKSVDTIQNVSVPDNLYRGFVTYNPLLLRSVPIVKNASALNRYLTNTNSANMSFRQGYEDVQGTVSYNINDMLRDPDDPQNTKRNLGFAPTGDKIQFKLSGTLARDGVSVSATNPAFETGYYEATRTSANIYTCDVTVNGEVLFTITFKNEQGTPGIMTVTAKQAVEGNVRVSFAVSDGGAAISDALDPTFSTYQYGLELYFLSSLPTVEEKGTETVANNNVATMYSGQRMVFDINTLYTGGYISERDIIEKSDPTSPKLYFVPPKFVLKEDGGKTYYPAVEYYDTAAGEWKGVGLNGSEEVIQERFSVLFNGSALVVTALQNSAEPVKLRFYVTNVDFGYGTDNINQKSEFDVSGNIAEFAVPVYYTFKIDAQDLLAKVDEINVDYTGADYDVSTGYYTVDLTKLAKNADGDDVANVNFYYNPMNGDEYKNITIGAIQRQHLKIADSDFIGYIKKDGSIVGAGKDIILDYQHKKLSFRPQSRTLNGASTLYLNLLLTEDGAGAADGSTNGSKGSSLQFLVNIPNTEFELTDANTVQYQNADFNINNKDTGVTVSVNGIASAADNEFVVDKNGIVAKTRSTRGSLGYYFDLYDRYYLSVPANTEYLGFTGEGKSITVGSNTYYERVRVKPLKYRDDNSDGVPDANNVTFYVVDVNAQSSAGAQDPGTAKELHVDFFVAKAGITTTDVAGLLDVLNQMVFLQDNTIRTDCPHRNEAVDPCAPDGTFAFCDGEYHYERRNYATSWTDRYLSTIFRNEDLALSGTKYTDLTGYKLTLECFEAAQENGKFVAKGDPLTLKSTDTSIERNLADFTSGELVWETDWFRLTMDSDQKFNITLLSRSGIEKYADGIVFRLTIKDGGTGINQLVQSYESRILTRDNPVIIAPVSANEVVFDPAAPDGLVKKNIDISRYVFDFNGDEVAFNGSGEFVDQGAAFSELYNGGSLDTDSNGNATPYANKYVTKSANSSSLTVTLNKLHSVSKHEQAYSVRIPVRQKVAGAAELTEVGNLQVKFRFENRAADTGVSDTYNQFTDGTTLSYPSGGTLYSIPTGGEFILYASAHYYMADPYAEGKGSRVIKGMYYNATTRGVPQQFIVGKDGDIRSGEKYPQDSLTFKGYELQMMYVASDGTATTDYTLAGAKNQGNAANYFNLVANKVAPDAPAFDGRQIYSYAVQAKSKLTDDKAFIRMKLSLTDTAGNPVAYGADNEGKYVVVDFRISDSEITAAANSDWKADGKNEYAVELQSARAAWGNKMPVAGLNPTNVQEFSIEKLIYDADINNYEEKFVVKVGDLVLGMSSDAMYEQRNLSNELVFKMGYDPDRKMLLFYSFKKTSDPVKIPNLTFSSGLDASAPSGSVVFNAPSGGPEFYITVADSAPMLISSSGTIDLVFNQSSRVYISDFLYDYDGDPIHRSGEDIQVEAVNNGDVKPGPLTEKEIAEYIDVNQAFTYGVEVSTKGLLKVWNGESGVPKFDTDIKFTFKIYTTTGEVITLTSTYSSPSLELKANELPEGYEMNYDGSQLSIVYSGSDAVVGSTVKHNLNDFFNLSGFLTALNVGGASAYKQYVLVTVAGTTTKIFKSENGGFYTTEVKKTKVGDFEEVWFTIRDSAGNYPVYGDARIKIDQPIRLAVKVANTAPVVNKDYDNMHTEDKVFKDVITPGGTLELYPDQFATDVNGDTLKFVPNPSPDGSDLDPEVPLDDDAEGAFSVRHVLTGGVYDGSKIIVSVDKDKYMSQLTSGKNIVIPVFTITDNNGANVTVRNLIIKVVLMPNDALVNGKNQSNSFTAYRNVPMYFDVEAAKLKAGAKAAVRPMADTGTGDFEQYAKTTLVNPSELFANYGSYIKVVDIAPGEGYTVDKENKTINVNTAESELNLSMTFQSGTDVENQEAIDVKVTVVDALPAVVNGIAGLDKGTTPAGTQKEIDARSLITDQHGRKVIILSAVSNDELLLSVMVNKDRNTLVLTPHAAGNVSITIEYSIEGQPGTFRTEEPIKLALTNYDPVSWWTRLLDNPLILWCSGAALFVILLIIIFAIAKHSRKKRMMKELETMLLAEMEADEQLKLSDNSSMMNMGYNPYQLGAGGTAPGYDPNMLNLGPGMGSQSQMNGYDPNQFNQPQQGYGPGQFGGSQMNGYDQFGGSQMGGFDQNQFGNDPNQFSQFDAGSYIDLDDFNDNKK